MNACGSAIGGRLVHKANRLNGKSGFPARASRFFDRFRPRKHAPLTAARPVPIINADLCHMGLCSPMDWRNQNMKPHSRFNAARRALLFWCLFIGIGAVAGAVGMLAAPDGSALGMEGLLPYFQVLPLAEYLYQDFVFPGIALLCVNGIPNLIAAALLFRHKKAGIILGGIFGLTLMAWITIQFVIFPANFMSTTYFIFGFLQAAAGCCFAHKMRNFCAQIDSNFARKLIVTFFK